MTINAFELDHESFVNFMTIHFRLSEDHWNLHNLPFNVM